MQGYALICQRVSISYVNVCMEFQAADLPLDDIIYERLVMQDHGK